ncbi:hypothetical protein C2G38_2162209 [Gigaspora rosea]|uniref:Uncharacterized protein n=1 Tax=Gigaspora rosea TaxID=44941 RepID=A0A397W692_9GLOM|nr:hypothetical protein C2G38_2162209 [Gigaspora rosea]
MADVERLVSLVGIMVRLVAATVKELRLKHCWSGRSINVVGHDCATHVESLDIMHVSVCKYLKIERILNVEKIVRRSKNEEWKSTNLDDEDGNKLRRKRVINISMKDRNVKEKGKIEDKPERSGGRRISKRYRKSAKIESPTRTCGVSHENTDGTYSFGNFYQNGIVVGKDENETFVYCQKSTDLDSESETHNLVTSTKENIDGDSRLYDVDGTCTVGRCDEKGNAVDDENDDLDEAIGNRAMMNSSGGIKKGFEWNLKCTEVGDCSAENTNEMYNIGCYYERRTKISIWTLKSREQGVGYT